ncbi:MAG: hypothetical protein ACRDYZ_10450 [Acidimicrobiales bacterium]
MGVRRPELVVAGAIVLCLPFLPSVLDGGLSLASALVRFALAVTLCWAAGAVIERVLDTYSRQARQAEIRRAVEEARARFGAPGPQDGLPTQPGHVAPPD